MAPIFLITDIDCHYSAMLLGESGLRSQVSGLRLPYRGYQRLRDFRGRGNLWLIVETLQVRWVAPAQEWRFNLWPAVVCLFHFSSCSHSQPHLRCSSESPFRLGLSVRSRQAIRPILRQMWPTETGQAPSLQMDLGQRLLDVRQMAGIGLICVIGVVIRKTTCAGIGTSVGELFLDNRLLNCGFELTSGR
jgi:hypothetical protein